MLYTTICNSHKAVPQHTNWDGGLELFQNAFQSFNPIGQYIIYGHMCIEIARNISHTVPTARVATVSVATFAWTMLYNSDTPMQC